MSDNRPKRESMSVAEATVSTMWEIAAIVEELERKGLCTKQNLYDIITEFRPKHHRAGIPEMAFSELYLSPKARIRSSTTFWSSLGYDPLKIFNLAHYPLLLSVAE